MKFFVRISEQSNSDGRARQAMLQHRVDSIDYQEGLLKSGAAWYSFRTDSGDESIAMLEATTLEDLDRLVKADPSFGYSEMSITPVVSTPAMARELMDYLGEEVLSEDELSQLDPPRKAIDPDGVYCMAMKKLNVFSPIMSDEEQREIHRKTLRSQRGHFSNLEYADHNPAGRPVGILIGNCDLAVLKHHVASTEIFPHTTVEFTRLQTLSAARARAHEELDRLGARRRVAAGGG